VNTTIERSSLNMRADPSHMATPPAPGWKLKIAFIPISFVQLMMQTGIGQFVAEKQFGVVRPEKSEPTT